MDNLEEARREFAAAEARIASLAAQIPDELPRRTGVIERMPSDARQRLWAARSDAMRMIADQIAELRRDRERLTDRRNGTIRDFSDAMARLDWERMKAILGSIEESGAALLELEEEIGELESFNDELMAGPRVGDATAAAK